MRSLFLPLLFLASSFPAGAQIIETGKPAAIGPIRIELDGVPTSALVTMLMRDVMRVPYVIAPEVLADRKLMSVRLSIPRDDIPVTIVRFLRRSGFTVTLDGGTVYVSRAGGAQLAPLGSQLPPDALTQLGTPVASNSPSAAVAPAPGVFTPGLPSRIAPDARTAIYFPAHRTPAELAGVLSSMFPDVVFSNRAQQSADPTQQQVVPTAEADTLLIRGSASDLAIVRSVLVDLDLPQPMVSVRAVIMQVNTGATKGSAFNFLLSIGGGKVQLGSGSTQAPSGQFLRLAFGGLDAVLTASSTDNRVKIVAKPSLLAKSGSTASINAGAQVPTLGSVTITDNGAAVQSVVYRDSGLTLTVKPVVRGGLIELEVTQERSTFARTTTGVQDSPTLQRSTSKQTVILKNGATVAIAGVTEQTEGKTRSGLLGGLLAAKTSEKSDTELVIVLEATVEPSSDEPGGTFVVYPAKADLCPSATTAKPPLLVAVPATPRGERAQSVGRTARIADRADCAMGSDPRESKSGPETAPSAAREVTAPTNSQGQ